MDTLLCQGDFKTDERGIPIQIKGKEELAQQIMIRLCIPLGNYELDKSLGSLLYTLPKTDNQKNSERARRYIESALVDMGCLEVEDVECRYNQPKDRLEICFRVALQDSFVEMEVSV